MSTRLRLGLMFRSSAALLLLSRGASAQLGPPCFSDVECEEGFVCSTSALGAPESQSASDAGSAIEVGAVPDGGQRPENGGTVDTGAALPGLPPIVVAGNCVADLEPCEDDADCEPGYHCELHGVGANTRSCEESGTCNASEAGEGAWLCAPNDVSCEVNTDCPDPAVCSDGECFYELNSCAVDSDCASRYVCSASRNEDSCELDAGEGAEECPDDLIRMCFPPPVACDSDADCEGWVCHSVPQSGNPPIGWQDLDKACMPPGLVAALEDRIEVRGDAIDEARGGGEAAEFPVSGEADQDRADAGAAVGDQNATSAEPDKAVTDAGDERPTDDASGDSDAGCSVAAGCVRSTTWYAMLFALALLQWRRTRRCPPLR